jgi:hypothetical protein
VVKRILLRFLLLAGPSAGVLATAPNHVAPADILLRAERFDGQQIITGGHLLSVSDRCLSLDHLGFEGGMFAITKHDADLIRAYYRQTGRTSFLISGTFRAHFAHVRGDPVRPCAEAGIEGISIPSGEP